MKTHDMAKALNDLAKMLRALPNEDLELLPTIVASSRKSNSADIAIGLSTLASLASYGKSQWLAVISDFNLPIEVRPRDAARDVLGKLLSYLEENKEARERLSQDARSRSKSSKEVTSALQFLLKNG